MDKKKILIVDDEIDVLSVLEKGLADEEFTVIKANNGTNAIILAQSKCPDIIILDLMIPDMHGEEILKELREDPKTKDIPVIFLSSLLSKDVDVEKNQRIYGEVLITKPYDMEELSAKIEEALPREKKVLIVEDEMDVRSVLEKMLTKEGYSVITAYNGHNGLVSAKTERPDLIILDRVLGDMLGEEVATKLKEDIKTKNIPIIFLSALFSKEEEKDPVFGGHTMFAKPYEKQELITAIRKLLQEDNRISTVLYEELQRG